MTDFSEARNAFCRKCRTWFCPEDGGCNCDDDRWDRLEEELVKDRKNDWEEER